MGMIYQKYWLDGPFRNVWSLIKKELFPFVNLFSILFFLVRNDSLLSIISAVTSELFNFFCKYSCIGAFSVFPYCIDGIQY